MPKPFCREKYAPVLETYLITDCCGPVRNVCNVEIRQVFDRNVYINPVSGEPFHLRTGALVGVVKYLVGLADWYLTCSSEVIASLKLLYLTLTDI